MIFRYTLEKLVVLCVYKPSRRNSVAETEGTNTRTHTIQKDIFLNIDIYQANFFMVFKNIITIRIISSFTKKFPL